MNKEGKLLGQIDNGQCQCGDLKAQFEQNLIPVVSWLDFSNRQHTLLIITPRKSPI